MKVSEVLKLVLCHIPVGQNQVKRDKIDELIEMALENIRMNIVKTDSIDKVIELKKLHKDIEVLRDKSWRLERIFDEEIDE